MNLRALSNVTLINCTDKKSSNKSFYRPRNKEKTLKPSFNFSFLTSCWVWGTQGRYFQIYVKVKTPKITEKTVKTTVFMKARVLDHAGTSWAFTTFSKSLWIWQVWWAKPGGPAPGLHPELRGPASLCHFPEVNPAVLLSSWAIVPPFTSKTHRKCHIWTYSVVWMHVCHLLMNKNSNKFSSMAKNIQKITQNIQWKSTFECDKIMWNWGSDCDSNNSKTFTLKLLR